MLRISVIGIGAGGADLLTVQAVEALRAADVFFLFDKGEEKAELAQLRKQICARYCTAKLYRFVEIASPPRDPRLPYRSAVASWHDERARLAGDAISATLAPGETGAFLAWGDPVIYDSTLRILDAIKVSGVDMDYEVIPGISSVQLLCARHKIPLNDIGEPVLFTTGRKLAQEFPRGSGTIVVFLDNGDGLRSLAGRNARIYWGAYLGTGDEIVIAGEVGDVLGRICEVRAAHRRVKGWIMDVYLLRQPRV